MTIDGTVETEPVGTTISTTLANGSYPYSIHDYPGWHQTTEPYSGTVTVKGPTNVPELLFAQVTYEVQFEETGLADGVTWGVLLNTSFLPRVAPAAVTFESPNGTDYPYQIGDPEGWHLTQGSYTGTVTVVGGTHSIDGSYLAATVSVTFAQTVYPVTFTASGLTGERWGVTINGTALSRVGSGSLSVSLPNGTWTYSLANVPGWHATIPYSGGSSNLGAIQGGPVLEPFRFSQATYAVSFSASGLTGETWGVTINGSALTMVGNGRLTANLPNGTFSYLIQDVPGWHQTILPYSGTGAISGGGFTEPTLAFAQELYAVTFTAAGLTGERWAVTVNTTDVSRTGNGALTVDLPNGTWTYSLHVPAGWVPGIPYSGGSSTVGAIHGLPLPIFADFSAFLYSVTFGASGLTGELWSVTINGTAYSHTGDGSVTTYLPNGSFTYAIADVAGWHQSTLPYSGSGAVDGAPVVEPRLAFTQVVYSVTFTESGLPLDSSWSVEINGSTVRAPTGSPASLPVANGSLSYVIEDKPGWHQNTMAYSGTLTVQGAALQEPTLVFVQVVYAVTFTESGLPGSSWSITINGTLYSGATGTGLSAELPNGTFTYSLANVPGYHQSTLPYSGSGAVAGSPVTEPTFAFTRFTYAVTFTESGIRAGSWSVTINGTLRTVLVGNPISTDLPNGSFTYTISNVPDYHQSTLPYSGSAEIQGAPVSEPTLEFTPVVYPVTFTEAGLASGTTWSITFNGSTQSAATASIVFANLLNGTYEFRVGSVTGYSPDPSSGAVRVQGESVTVGVQFIPIPPSSYPVTFSESGLPSNLNWGVTVNGTFYSSSAGASITAYLRNGSVPYSIEDVAGWHQRTIPYTGIVTVEGAAVVEPTLSFSEVTYTVLFTETGLPDDQSWGVNLNGSLYTADAGSPISASFPNGTIPYEIVDVAGWHQETLPYVGEVSVSGEDIAEPTLAFAQVTYAVEFTEAGLPTGSEWGVVVGGTPYTAPASGTITAYLPNGSAAYSVEDVPGWHQSTLPYSGTIPVSGGAVVEPTLQFFAVTYSVTFTESGLPSGTSWSVTLNGTTESGSSTSILFEGVANGSYDFSLGSPGYAATPSSGVVEVAGASSLRTTVFAPIVVTYTVSFGVSGLPDGTSWSVTLGGVTESATSPGSIEFSDVANGTYGFTIAPVPGFRASPDQGSVHVVGAGVTLSVTFTAIPPELYVVTFQASGLPPGRAWSVQVGSTTETSTATTLAFDLTNGTYPFIAGGSAPYAPWPSSTGSVVVAGANLTVNLPYSFTYAVTFTASGLPNGTAWNVTVTESDPGRATAGAGGASWTVTSTTSTASLYLANGSYEYAVSATGYSTISGALPVQGGAMTQPVTFGANGASPPATWEWVLLGAAIAVVVAGVVVLFLRRRGRAPSSPGSRPG